MQVDIFEYHRCDCVRIRLSDDEMTQMEAQNRRPTPLDWMGRTLKNQILGDAWECGAAWVVFNPPTLLFWPKFRPASPRKNTKGIDRAAVLQLVQRDIVRLLRDEGYTVEVEE